MSSKPATVKNNKGEPAAQLPQTNENNQPLDDPEPFPVLEYESAKKEVLAEVKKEVRTKKKEKKENAGVSPETVDSPPAPVVHVHVGQDPDKAKPKKDKEPSKKQPAAPWTQDCNDQVATYLEELGVDPKTAGRVYCMLYRVKPEMMTLDDGTDIEIGGFLARYDDSVPTVDKIKKRFGGGTYRIQIRGPRPETGTGDVLRGQPPLVLIAGDPNPTKNSPSVDAVLLRNRQYHPQQQGGQPEIGTEILRRTQESMESGLDRAQERETRLHDSFDEERRRLRKQFDEERRRLENERDRERAEKDKSQRESAEREKKFLLQQNKTDPLLSEILRKKLDQDPMEHLAKLAEVMRPKEDAGSASRLTGAIENLGSQFKSSQDDFRSRMIEMDDRSSRRMEDMARQNQQAMEHQQAMNDLRIQELELKLSSSNESKKSPEETIMGTLSMTKELMRFSKSLASGKDPDDDDDEKPEKGVSASSPWSEVVMSVANGLIEQAGPGVLHALGMPESVLKEIAKAPAKKAKAKYRPDPQQLLPHEEEDYDEDEDEEEEDVAEEQAEAAEEQADTEAFENTPERIAIKFMVNSLEEAIKRNDDPIKAATRYYPIMEDLLQQDPKMADVFMKQKAELVYNILKMNLTGESQFGTAAGEVFAVQYIEEVRRLYGINEPTGKYRDNDKDNDGASVEG